MAQVLDNLASSLNGLSIRIDPFDGSDDSDPKQFVENFLRYLRVSGKISPDQITNDNDELIENPDKDLIEKETLRMHLRGDARSWYKTVASKTDPALTFNEILAELQERFKITDQRKHVKRLAVYQTKQQPTESFRKYVSRVVDMSYGLEMKEQDLVTIVTQGAHPSIRNHLVMKQPDSIKALMALPLAHSGPGGSYEDIEFVGVIATQPAAQAAPAKARFTEPMKAQEETRGFTDAPGDINPRPTREDFSPRRSFLPRSQNNFPQDDSRPMQGHYSYSRSPGRGDGYSRSPGRGNEYARSPGRSDYRSPGRSPLSDNRLCIRCGYSNCASLVSARNDCIAEYRLCLGCNRPGHFISMCRSRDSQSPGRNQSWHRYSGNDRLDYFDLDDQ